MTKRTFWYNFFFKIKFWRLVGVWAGVGVLAMVEGVVEKSDFKENPKSDLDLDL